MTTLTTEISLEKIANGELVDSWDSPVNDNWDKLDAAIGYLLDSIRNASGSQSDTTPMDIANLVKGTADSLKKRLDKGLELDGTVKATPEVTYAKFDRLIGSLQGNFEALARAGQMFFWASQGQVDTSSSTQPDRLRKEIGRRGKHKRNSVLGDNLIVSIAGGVPTVQPSSGIAEFDIGGKIYNIRKATTSEDGAVSGKNSVFAYMQEGLIADQQLYAAGDGEMLKSGTPTGAWNKISSVAVGAFTDALPGDILRIESNTVYGYDIAGDYVIFSVSGVDIQIFGGLPVPEDTTSVSAINFKVLNPFAAKLKHDSIAVTAVEYGEVGPAPATVDDRAYVGEVHYDGAAVVDSFSYRDKGVYDTGWQDAPALSSPSPLNVSGDHRIGLGLPAFQAVSQKTSPPLKARVFVAQKNAQGHIFDAQEIKFNSEIGGSTAPAVRASGWFGYLTRKSFNILYGSKLPVGAGYGYQRKSDVSGFPNDGALDASYVTTQSNSVYRVVIERD